MQAANAVLSDISGSIFEIDGKRVTGGEKLI
jgi:hypothetical protein